MAKSNDKLNTSFEQEYINNLTKNIKRLQVENKKLREENHELFDTGINLSIKVKKLKKCVEFYADHKNWGTEGVKSMYTSLSDIKNHDLYPLTDWRNCGGKRARTVLKELEEGE